MGPPAPGRLTLVGPVPPDDLEQVRASFGEVDLLAPATAAPSATGTVLGARRVGLLEHLGSAGSLVRLLDGPRAGVEVVVPARHLERVEVVDERPPPLHRLTPDPAATERAESLLHQLLRPHQRHQRATAGTFWVHNRHGWFRLGVLYDIRYRAARLPWVERSVCVVSEGYEQRPAADLWAELVVVLGADPTQVTGVANWNGEADPTPPAQHRAGLARWLGDIRTEFRQRRRQGDVLHAAYLAFDVAHRLRRIDRPTWALPYAAKAAELVTAWADRWPDDAASLLEHHAGLLGLPHDLQQAIDRQTPGAAAPPPQRGR